MLSCEEASARNFEGREKVGARERPVAKSISNSKIKTGCHSQLGVCVWMFNFCFALRVATRLEYLMECARRQGQRGERWINVWISRLRVIGFFCFFFCFFFMKRTACPQQFTLCVRTLRKIRTPTLTLTSLRSVLIHFLATRDGRSEEAQCFFGQIINKQK